MVNNMYSSRLKQIRVDNNLYQKKLAEYLGISEISYTHYESEYYIMPIKYLNLICNYFEISIDFLFNFTEKNYYNNSNLNIDKIKSGKRLKEFRKEIKITQKKLADILNVNQSTIAEYERGTNVIATPFLYTISKKYHISADYLLGKIDEPKYFD